MALWIRVKIHCAAVESTVSGYIDGLIRKDLG